MIVDNLMEKLPDVYNKSEQSGIYKIIKLAADQIQKGEETLLLIQEWRDIDQAEGRTLDKLGKDVGQPREGLDDGQYRQAIKIKIRANLSGGEIETLNSIAVVLLGDRFDGIQEGWTLPSGHPIGKRSAMMLFTVRADGVRYGIPMAEIDKISAGGVAANWELLIGNAVDIAQTDYEHWEAPYKMTGEFTTATEQQQGPIYLATIEASTQSFASVHSLVMAGAAKAGEGVLV